MNFLSNMRISHKISALMVGLILGFIAIGVTYYVQVTIDTSQRKQQSQAVDFQGAMSELQLQQVLLHAFATEYFGKASNESSAQYELTFDKTLGLLADAKSMASGMDGSGSALSTFKKIKSALNSHADAFKEAQQAIEERQSGTAIQQQFDRLAFRFQNASKSSKELQAVTGPLQNALATYMVTPSNVNLNDINQHLSNANKTLTQWGRTNAVKAARNGLDKFAEAVTAYHNANMAVVTIQAGLNSEATELSALISGISASAKTLAQSTQEKAVKNSQTVQAIVTAIIFTVAILTSVGIYLIYHSIIFPMAHMQSVIQRINRGKFGARVKLLNNDELGDLGKAFNTLFDERIQQLEDQSRENDRLNNSIISLIRALGDIANKDLTVKVPVSEDITGTVSDAVNLLTNETAQTLQQVKDISNQVNTISSQLQDQSLAVSQVAESERRQVIATTKSLDVLARAMNDVAAQSGNANLSATKAIESTRLAKSSVVETVSGIRTIRETISETEKRMKRLGDRSQEISGIVNLINTIAERTHILALNASMHAASAGEAGKGFAVVADEVQRLAESARESTDEISAMVNNIRVETSDTVNIMNTLISQVADGSRTAEKAGQQMTETETATHALVETVKVIAEQATRQAQVANQVRDRATVIRKFTEKTAQELDSQKISTDGLREFAETLVERVNVFTLPEQRATNTQNQASPSLKSVG